MLSRDIVRISSRTSGAMGGRPPRRQRDFHVQYRRKPLWCHRTKVSGLKTCSSAGTLATDGRARPRTAVDPSEIGVACVVLGSPSPAVGEALEFQGVIGLGSGTGRVAWTVGEGRSFSCRDRTTTAAKKSTESTRTMFLVATSDTVPIIPKVKG